ncbi:DNA primase [Demequina sp. NBRC 110051]|uniref:DNA primase n=1 Tax=Demequina sp. NBRC 110051 TaxID=1570340 RepID=UPI000A07778A|nr:DNA primase [Demequina sp. NBRC 110051]
MAGTINRDDIAQVRERAPIEDIIGQHVALKPAGVGSVKGLCPFHDERSPSFHVRPGAGRWHCFGCGEGGDVIEFVMRMDGLPFAEAVEYLAERAGVTLRYEAGGGPRREGTAGQRKRLLEAHRVAQQYFADQLNTPDARIGRDFLRDRGFDREAAEHFGVGYAPQGWNHLTDHLQSKGFTQEELRASGLVSEGQRGIYDRFRGRLVWPIRDVTGEVIGFGARRLHEDDQGPKYLNTPETPLYKKNQVLYGIDLAKGAIRAERTTVVVEGYTDVMACHLAGITNAVATCGTAFGEEHVKVVRRLMGDVGGSQLKIGSTGAKVIFTFDGDEAGQNAALKSFQLDQQFLAQTFVAVDPEGNDPCDLRMGGGDAAVQALLEHRQPLFEFVIRASLAQFDLDTPEGRAGALRAAAPVVAGIRDRAIQPEYTRLLAGWLGMEMDVVRRQVADASRGRGGDGQSRRASPSAADAWGGPVGGASGDGVRSAAGPARPDRRDPVVRAEALSLGTLLQAPSEISHDPFAAAIVKELTPESYTVPQYRAVYEAILAAGGPGNAGPDWANDVAEQAGDTLVATISELAVSPLPHDKPETLGHYAGTVLARVLDLSLTRQVAALRGRMQRAGTGTPEAQEAFAEMIRIETRRRELRES